jgi:hypothetical protein
MWITVCGNLNATRTPTPVSITSKGCPVFMMSVIILDVIHARCTLVAFPRFRLTGVLGSNIKRSHRRNLAIAAAQLASSCVKTAGSWLLLSHAVSKPASGDSWGTPTLSRSLCKPKHQQAQHQAILIRIINSAFSGFPLQLTSACHRTHTERSLRNLCARALRVLFGWDTGGRGAVRAHITKTSRSSTSSHFCARHTIHPR